MDRRAVGLNNWLNWFPLLAVFILVACQPSDSTPNPQATERPAVNAFANPPATTATTTADLTMVPTVTTVDTSTPQPTWTWLPPGAGTKEAYDTAIAHHMEAIGTSVALTHAPPPTEVPVYPTETPVMGMLQGCTNANAQGPQCVDAWRGVMNGEILQVETAQEDRDGDPTQGLLIVHIWYHSGEDVYKTPRKEGTMRIISVDGTRVTIAPVDLSTPRVLDTPWATVTPGTEFVFDLATRQWVSP